VHLQWFSAFGLTPDATTAQNTSRRIPQQNAAATALCFDVFRRDRRLRLHRLQQKSRKGKRRVRFALFAVLQKPVRPARQAGARSAGQNTRQRQP